MSNTITIDRAVVEQALDAMRASEGVQAVDKAAAALRAALNQPPRKPLTRQQIQQLVIAVCDKIYPQDGESYSEVDSVFYGALAHVIERSHGIGGEPTPTPRMCPSTYYECSRDCGDGTCKDFADAHGNGGKA